VYRDKTALVRIMQFSLKCQKSDVEEVRTMHDKLQSVQDVALALDSVTNSIKSMESSVNQRLSAAEQSLVQKADIEKVRRISKNFQSASAVRGCMELGALKSS